MRELILRLAKGSVIYGTGAVAQRVLGFLLIPLYTRFLTTSDYGIVAVVNTVTSVFTIVLGMGLSGAVVRQYYTERKTPHAFSVYMGTIQLFFVAVSIPAALLLIFLGRPLFNALFAEIPFSPYMQLALGTAAFGAVGGILLGLYRAREQAGRYVALQLGKFLLTLALVVFFVVALRQGAIGKIKGVFFASGVVAVLVMYLVAREGTLAFSPRKLRDALVFGMPLVPHLLSAWALGAADRILLERLTSLTEVGLYDLGYRIGMVMSLFVFAMNSAWTPIFYDIADNASDAKRILSRMATVFAFLAAVLAVGVILFSREVILVMAARDFWRAHLIVPTVAVGYLFQGLYFVSVAPIFYKKKTFAMPAITLCAAALNIGLNLLWIPAHGMMGAAYATVVAFAVLFGLTHLVAQKYYTIPYEYGKLLRLVLLVGVVYTINALVKYPGVLWAVLLKSLIGLSFLGLAIVLRIVSVREFRKAARLFRR